MVLPDVGRDKMIMFVKSEYDKEIRMGPFPPRIVNLSQDETPFYRIFLILRVLDLLPGQINRHLRR